MCKVGLESETLKNAMVFDFKNLNFVKKIIDEDLDHKFMMDENDPLFDRTFGEIHSAKEVIEDKKFYKVVNSGKLKNYNFSPEIKEKLEGLVVVDFVPTSENICKMLYDLIESKLDGIVNLSFVELWETPKSHCRYTRTK